MSGALQRASLVLVALALLLGPVAGAQARIAFVADGSTHVVAFDTATNQIVGSPITTDIGPFGIAITPDGRKVYVTNIDVGQMQVIDPATRQVVGSPILVGGGPEGTAITPDGRRVYVATNGGKAVAVVDTLTDFVGPPITLGTEPGSVAITPDGRSAYATNFSSDEVSILNLAGNQATGAITVGSNPRGIAITPDGRRAYSTNEGSGSVSVIDTATNQVISAGISVGEKPHGIAITPDGTRAYVVNEGSGSVSVINTATNQVVGSQIPVGSEPKVATITPDGTRAYIAVQGDHNVVAIDTATNQVVGSPVPVGGSPQAIAITPDQAPIAAFTHFGGRVGAGISFDTTGSRDPDGTVARFGWDFGDGQAESNGGPAPKHTYRKPGKYPVTLTVTDNEGCSTALKFTGQTAYCNAAPAAALTQVVSVAYPAVRVKCPKGAKPGGCRFKLTALTKRRKGKAMTKVAKAKVRAGRSKAISLTPKPRFAARLGGASKVLVRERVTIDGSVEKRLLTLPLVRQPD